MHINYKCTRDEAMSPVHTMESIAARSDKQTEVVIYVLTGTFLLVFAPYVSRLHFIHGYHVLVTQYHSIEWKVCRLNCITDIRSFNLPALLPAVVSDAK